MPYGSRFRRRRFGAYRRRPRWRRPIRRRYRRRRPLSLVRPPRSPVYTFSRSLLNENYVATTDGAGHHAFSQQVSFAQLPNYTEFTGLFDQYRITSIKIRFFFRAGNVDDIDDVVAPGVDFPIIYYAQDKDNNTPISLTDMLQVQGHKMKFFGHGARSKYSMMIPPYVLRRIEGVDGGGPWTGPVKSPWIDLADVGTVHGCTKFVIAGSALTDYRFNLDMKVTFQCRGVR